MEAPRPPPSTRWRAGRPSASCPTGTATRIELDGVRIGRAYRKPLRRSYHVTDIVTDWRSRIDWHGAIQPNDANHLEVVFERVARDIVRIAACGKIDVTDWSQPPDELPVEIKSDGGPARFFSRI